MDVVGFYAFRGVDGNYRWWHIVSGN